MLRMLKGFYPPIPTPFLNDGFMATHLEENLSLWNRQPLDGYVVLGSNGEAPLLDDEERAAVVKTARGAIPAGRTMIVGTGRESTRDTVRSTVQAFELGADAVLVGVPSYYRPAMSSAVLEDHFLRVADASPGPMLLYSVPFFTDIPIEPGLFGKLIRHERIVGIKDSSGDIGSVKALAEQARAGGRDISILVGSASVLAGGLASGACGGVLAVACVAGRACAEIARLVDGGEMTEAGKLNEQVAELAIAVTKRHGIGGLKAALDLLHFYGGDPRPPLPPAGPEARAEIAGLMTRLGLLT
jgi:4-hydroxy-2-oxoglutarate aldolase